jgi:ribosomal protein S18 acetylase RimI-like enzyme
MELVSLKNQQEAEKVIAFLCGPNAFHWQLPEGEQQSVREIVTKAVGPKDIPQYWFYRDKDGEVIGAGGIEKLPDTEGGYFLSWFAIHKDFRKQGLGRKIVEQVEKYAGSLGGRFMTIDTGADNSAQAFYEKCGYTKVGQIPEYFEDHTGKIIYFKKL